MALTKEQKEFARIDNEYRKNFMVESGIEMPDLPEGAELPQADEAE